MRRIVRIAAGTAMVTASSYIFAARPDDHLGILLPAGFVVLFWRSI